MYLSKNNFIFIPEILEHVFHVVHQVRPALIGIQFYPLVFDKAPQYFYTIQFRSIFWKIKDGKTLLFPQRNTLLKCLTRMDGRVIHNHNSFLVQIFTKITDASDDYATINGAKAAIGLSFIILTQKPEHV